METWAETLFQDMGKTRGLAIMILDIFEDMLDEKGIMIPTMIELAKMVRRVFTDAPMVTLRKKSHICWINICKEE